MEFKVGSELSHLDRGGSVAEDMFVPKFGKTYAGERFDLARRQNVVDVVTREPTAVDRESVEVHLAALPADKLLEIDLEHPFEAALVCRAAANAPRHVGLNVADIRELVFDAFLEETFSISFDVGEYRQVVDDRVFRLIVPLLGARRHRRERRGDDKCAQ